ncbi:MAG: UvrD-helicase domain-containing protein [bacterium]|nr:UvrD-helicase domain-containing protein [bacterium]
MSRPVLPGDGTGDARARRSAAEDLDRDLFLEAGAGTGKTTALVARIMALVRSGVALSSVAAITFTEKAAAELRERLRRELVEASRHAVAGEEAEILRGALNDLDGAAVCTLHSFAQRILREHATEAGLPPRLEMLDEIGADMEFAEGWERFVEGVLVEPQMERALVLGDALGMRVANLRSVARQMVDNWDLAVERIPAVGQVSEVPPLEYADLIVPMRELAADSRWCLIPLDGPERPDALCEALLQLGRLADRLEAADELEALVLLEEVARGPKPRSRKDNWHSSFDKEGMRDRLKELRAEADVRLDATGRACSARLLARLAGFVLADAERRRSQGRLVFHDLLVQARNLLRHPDSGAAVRRSLRCRYRRLLIDEFQDTDPIQVELALLIACEDPAESAGPPGWWDLEGGNGALFFVGDPKQSLYRFRRADIGLYLQVAEWAGPVAHETLSRNWRSSPAIVDWVNATFGQLVRPADGSQPDYVPLHAACRPIGGEAGAPVLLLGTDHLGEGESRGIPAEELRSIEFAEVAALIRRAVSESWPVRDGEGTQPLRLRDVCVLIPARTVLGPLIGAFEAAGLPYRVESSSLVYATRAEGDLLATLRAIDDPSDHLAVVTALRSTAFGFGDDDLYSYRQLCGGSHRSWDYLSPQPAHPVAEALAWMRELHTERLWRSPGEIVDRVIRERRLMELAFAEDRHRDTWRRLRRSADQARAFSDSTGGTLRAYLSWVDMQRGEGARVVEALVPESDDDAVRIMTVHAAKGLEFPFVVVAGFSGTTAPSRGNRSSEMAFPHSGGAFCKLGGRVRSFGSDGVATSEQLHEFHEDIRKLYVACTRAEDYLAVSLYRTGRKPDAWAKLAVAEALPRMTLAELLAHAVAEVVDPQTSGTDVAPHPLTVALDATGGAAEPGSETPASSPPGFAWALEVAGWTAGRPLETLQPGKSPYGAEAIDGSADPRRGDPGAGRSGHGSPPGTTTDAPAVAVPPRVEWERERAALWGLAARRPVVAASAIGAATGNGTAAPDEAQAVAAGGAGLGRPAERRAPDPGLDKHEPEDDAPVWRRGRYGTALGRAVHAVLQTADFDGPGEELAPQARRYAGAEGIDHLADDVAARARNALGAPVIREAARCHHWRELYAAAEVEGRLLEGFVDLLYEAPDGSFVVVDYKTHDSDERPDLRQKPGYRLQIAAYALTITEATGRPVSRCAFVFLGPNSTHEVEVDDLPKASEDVRRFLAGGDACRESSPR